MLLRKHVVSCLSHSYMQASTAMSVLFPVFAYDLHARPAVVVPVFYSRLKPGFYTDFNIKVRATFQETVCGRSQETFFFFNVMTNHFNN